ncbi:MAG TPA: hypothetical protein DCK95_02000 [Anaerolineaceae bacterium]|uniref:Lipoprotein n=1 Tax=Anaerolinea thermophila TaxID=167964 RepID=A0A101FZ10_9CHLR|nr:MAG: hypothetical protein XD73_0051 [Anaerolinea thermophila]HAF61079.1 hypothetical protein [Anaerolineaceae bacterium]
MNKDKSIVYFSVLLSLFLISGCHQDTVATTLRISDDPMPLTVEENRITDTDTDSPNHWEFMERLDQAVLSKRSHWKNLPPDLAVKDINDVLERYGYSIKHNPIMSSYTYRIFKGYTILLENVYPAGNITENSDKSDFTFFLYTNDGVPYLLQEDGLKEWHLYAPVLYQDELIYPVIGTSSIQIVTENGDTIFKTSLPSNPVMDPIQTFQVWNEHWVLEKDGELFIDGNSLNKMLGFHEIFNWQIIQGEPFFFFRKHADGPYSMMYAGKQLEKEYDTIIHYQCCEPAFFNPDGNNFMVWFYASREGSWYYVEAGIYPDLD